MSENGFATEASSGLIKGLPDEVTGSEVAICELPVRRRIGGWTLCLAVRNVETTFCVTETVLKQLYNKTKLPRELYDH